MDGAEKNNLMSTDADPTEEVLEPTVSLIGSETIDSKDSDINAGTIENVNQELDSFGVSEQNKLISELNDVALSSDNPDPDKFLESLSAENTTGAVQEEELIPKEEETAVSLEPTLPPEDSNFPIKEPTSQQEDHNAFLDKPVLNEEPSVLNEERSVLNEEHSVLNEEPSVLNEEPSVLNEEPVPEDISAMHNPEPAVDQEESLIDTIHKELDSHQEETGVQQADTMDPLKKDTSPNELLPFVTESKAMPTPMELCEPEPLIEKAETVAEKGPARSLEEELQRMHEGDNEQGTEAIFNHSEHTEQHSISIAIKEQVDAPIMKDSDLEEMLAADEVIQDPLVIKDSQNEMKAIDVLVCGTCHETFHFIEAFSTHKKKKCTQKSAVVPLCEFEGKAQVWGFMLWKNNKMKHDATESAWEVYRQWCELPIPVKQTWITAGQTLQYCHMVGNAKFMDVKVPTKGVSEDSNKENSTFETAKSPLLEVKRTVINKPKTVPTTSSKVNDANSNRAMRTVQSTTNKSEFAVEKIAAKRFNPKKKIWEYQIKWENFPSSDNTWEPLANLNHCKQMVEEFENRLKKLKAEKAKMQAASLTKNASPKVKAASPANVPANKGAGNRPQRTSKQKALDQVKAWCGNISDEDNPLSTKRARSPDSDESYEKRMKFDENSEDSESENPKPKAHFRKIAPKLSGQSQSMQVIKNGIGRNSPLPSNILIPDANGVVRINQRQLPSLSTGVYIMSKTAGIIKLDSTASKVATEGGHVVQVAPKVGQTEIKILKKEAVNSQKNLQLPKTHITKAKKVVTEFKPTQVMKRAPDIIKKTIITPKEQDKKMLIKKNIEINKMPQKITRIQAPALADEQDKTDSDDGIEELPFPEEIKIPEPDEEEAEFILDPATGKLAGVEYPDVPDPEPIEETKSDTSLDNIVKLAAADITEEDLKNEPQDPMDIDLHSVETSQDELNALVEHKIKTEPQIVQEPRKRFVSSVASPMKQHMLKMVTSKKVTTPHPSSILNKVLTGPPGTPVIRRTLVGAQQPKQRILNHSVARSSNMSSPMVRQVNTYVRAKPASAPRPKFNINTEPKYIRPGQENSPNRVYSYSRPLSQQNVSGARKIGNTTIRSSSAPSVNSPQPKPQARYVRTSTGLVQRVISPAKKEPVMRNPERKIIQQKPKSSISMPSLISDEELLMSTKVASQKTKTATVLPMQQTEEQFQQDETAAVVAAAAVEQASVAVVQEMDDGSAAQEQAVAAALAQDMTSFTLADQENPIFITGDDGTVYQVAGQNEQGQTILLTQGSDGQQQCLLVTNEVGSALEAQAAEDQVQPQPEMSVPDMTQDVTEPLSIRTDQTENSDQVVAQVVRAEPPSPGGTHKVVVMLPDGNLMVTQVSPEEYASLELE